MITSIKKGKEAIGNWDIVCIVAILICFLISILQSETAYATDRKKITGTFKQIAVPTWTKLYEAETKPVAVSVRHLKLSSADQAWNEATYFVTNVTIDPDAAMRGDDYRIYGIITDSGGNQAYIEGKGTWKPTTETEFNWSFESEGLFLGGTGKFEGIKATLKYKGKGSGLSTAVGEWVVEIF